MKHFKERIDREGINAQIIFNIIEAHSDERKRAYNRYERYKAVIGGVPILKREATEYEDFETGGNIKRIDNKVNNRLNNSFDADIVDTKIGYMFGHPISYGYDAGEVISSKLSIQEEIEKFNLRSHVEDEDAELGKMAAICGYSARLAYIDVEGKERIKNIDPWEVVFIGDSIHEPVYSLRYYLQGETTHVEFYDGAYIHFYTSDNGKAFILNDKPKPHMFEYNPLFGLENNKELQGDAEKVFSLIDAYDRTISDASNEIEQYRLAYLILRGMGADPDSLADLKKTGVLELLDKDDDVSYLTKNINDQMIENHLNRLEENILRFAKSVNFTDEAFGGNVSGVAMKFKLMALENKCITMERKVTAALRYQFKVLFSSWSKRYGVSKDDYLNVWFGFKRNLPVNLLEEAQVTASLRGNVSERTRLSLLSSVDDVEYEIQQMEDDANRLGIGLEPLEEELINFDDKNEPKGEGATSDDEVPCDTCGGDGKIPSPRTGNPIQCPTCKGTGVRKA